MENYGKLWKVLESSRIIENLSQRTPWKVMEPSGTFHGILSEIVYNKLNHSFKDNEPPQNLDTYAVIKWSLKQICNNRLPSWKSDRFWPDFF